MLEAHYPMYLNLHFQKLSPSCKIILIRVKNVYTIMPALSISGKIRMMYQFIILPLSAGCSLIALPCPNMHLFPFNRNLLHLPWSVHEVVDPRDSTQHSFTIRNLKPHLTALFRSRLYSNDKFPQPVGICSNQTPHRSGKFVECGLVQSILVWWNVGIICFNCGNIVLDENWVVMEEEHRITIRHHQVS
jgi:hypothetical protein